MKKIKFIIVAAFTLLFGACASVQSTARPAAAVITGEILQKDKVTPEKLSLVADGIDLLADGVNKDLQLEDFVNVVDKAGVSRNYALLSQYLYDIYKQKVTVGSSYLQAAKVLKEIAGGIRDGITINRPSK